MRIQVFSKSIDENTNSIYLNIEIIIVKYKIHMLIWTRFFKRAILAEFVFSKVWSLQKGTKHWLAGLWKQYFHIIVVCRLIYRTVKYRFANDLIPLMIYGLLKWVKQICHPVFGHIFHVMPRIIQIYASPPI